jgi:all-trans-retinol 13,14-reductase
MVTNDYHWDVICVGAGITSLAFGALLAQQNSKINVLVIDKHIIPGGYATNFRRKRHTNAKFDCSLHKISGTREEGGNFYRIFNYMAMDNDVSLIKHDDLYEAYHKQFRFHFDNDPVKFQQSLSEIFPDQIQGINQFFRELLVYGKDAYYHYQIMDGSYDVNIVDLRYAHRNLRKMTVAEAFDQRFSNDRIKNILAASTIYVGAFPEQLDYLYFLHILYATLCQGNCYVKGTVQTLSNALCKRIEAVGGKVQLKTEVTSVSKMPNSDAYRVNTSRGIFYGDHIYLNCSPWHAINELFEPAEPLVPVKKKLQELKPANSTTTLYVVLDDDPKKYDLPASETMFFDGGFSHCIRLRALVDGENEAHSENAYWRESIMEATNYYSINPADGFVVCLNVLDSMLHWPERNTKEYKAKKERAKNCLLDRLYEAKPKLKGHVIYTEVATPRTYYRFTNNQAGSGYGALVSTATMGHTFHHNFPYENIHFLSCWVAGSGYEAAFSYAEKMAKRWATAI